MVEQTTVGVRRVSGGLAHKSAWILPGLLAVLLQACVVAPPPVVVARRPPPPVVVEVPVPAPAEPAPPVYYPPPPHWPPPPPQPQPVPRPPPAPPAETYRLIQGVHVPPDRVPPEGTCRVWYADLPPDRQPERMSCAKARRDAQRTGGWVIWAQGPESFRSGTVAAEDFGPHGLHGVPPDRLPPPGFCRLWFEGTPPDRQPPPGPCAEVARRRGAEGGRLLYMPASDLRG